MVFLEHIWELASPVLLHRMPRTLAAVHFTWHCSHHSLAESVVGASGGRSSPFWLAGWFFPGPPEGQVSEQFSPRKANQLQHCTAHCRTSNAYNIGHTPPESCPTVPEMSAALLPGGTGAICPHFPWSRCSALAAAKAVVHSKNGWGKMVNSLLFLLSGSLEGELRISF